MASSAGYRHRHFSAASSLHCKEYTVNNHLMPQQQSYTARKRQSSDQCVPNEPASRAAYWDNLSKIWLTKSALKELDRRNAESTRASSSPQSTRRPVTRTYQRSRQPPPKATDYIHSDQSIAIKDIKRFARYGGPDLRDIRNYLEPLPSIPRIMNSSRSSQSRRAKGSVSSKNTKPTTTTTNTKSTGPYDRDFAQHLEDYDIFPAKYRFPDGSVPAKPENWEAINQRLAQPRSSLSPSRFSDEEFQRFEQADADAFKEMQVRESVFPIIEGRIPDGRCRSGEIPFANLAPLTDGNLVHDKPDIFYGARPRQVDQRVRKDLKDYIVPSKQDDLPLVPNFFVEAKGPDGTAAVANRQACYDGAIGARGMHHLQSYGHEELVYDNHARTITSIYYDGQLKMYTTHVTAPSGEGERPEYHMTQINAWGMTGNATTFRQGATAYRNARDWAKEQRDEVIEQANKVAVQMKKNEEAMQQVDQAEASGQASKRTSTSMSMVRTANESFVSTSSLRTTFSESEQYTLSQTSDIHDSQTTSDLHASHTPTKEAQSKEQFKSGGACSLHKRDENETIRRRILSVDIWCSVVI